MIQGEQEIEVLEKLGLTLTTHRVRQEMNINGYYVKSIMLEEITSCEMSYHKPTLLLWLAVAITIICIYGGVNYSAMIFYGLIVAIILVIKYIQDRGGRIKITTAGNEITTTKMNYSQEQLRSFIEKIEYAKNLRYYYRQ